MRVRRRSRALPLAAARRAGKSRQPAVRRAPARSAHAGHRATERCA